MNFLSILALILIAVIIASLLGIAVYLVVDGVRRLAWFIRFNRFFKPTRNR